MSTAMADSAASLVKRLSDRDRESASELVRQLQESGATPVELITDLLASAQRRVGELWQTNNWSVADEHAATSIVDRLLADVAGGIDVVPTLPPIVVACAEGDWHSLPARMFADMQRARGWLVAFLGGSVPAGDLGRHVRETSPHAVLISCTVPIHLTGALRSVAAVIDQGVPVLVGGAAFGTDDHRARAIGAHAWAASSADAHRILEDWQTRVPIAPQPRDAGPALALAADRQVAVDDATAYLERRLPDAPDHSAQPPTRLRENLDYALRFTEAAVLTEDATILTDYVAWLSEMFVAHGREASTVPLIISALHDALDDAHASAREILADEALRAGAS